LLKQSNAEIVKTVPMSSNLPILEKYSSKSFFIINVICLKNENFLKLLKIVMPFLLVSNGS